MKRFSRSFKPIVKLKPGIPCCWKNHFFNVLRELIGYLDAKAAKDPNRFVFSYVETIAKGCTKFRQGKAPYDKSIVEKGLAFLEEKGIIARVQVMETSKGTYHGFVVAPHDSACRSQGGFCCFCTGVLQNPPFSKETMLVTAVKFYPVPGAKK